MPACYGGQVTFRTSHFSEYLSWCERNQFAWRWCTSVWNSVLLLRQHPLATLQIMLRGRPWGRRFSPIHILAPFPSESLVTCCYFSSLYPPNMFLGTHQKMHNSLLRTCFCSSSLLMPFPTVSCLGLGWSTRHDQELQDGRSGNVRNIISQCQEVVLVSECVDIL